MAEREMKESRVVTFRLPAAEYVLLAIGAEENKVSPNELARVWVQQRLDRGNVRAPDVDTREHLLIVRKQLDRIEALL